MTRMVVPVRGRKLSAKEHLFVSELLADSAFNITDAARRAGYASPGQAGTKLMKRPEIAAAIAKAINARLARNELESDRVIQELGYLALRDPLDLCDKDGYIMVNDLRRLPERIRRCIDSLEVEQRTDPETGEVRQKIKLKLASKLGAVELAMKHFGLFAAEKHEVKGSLDWDSLLEPDRKVELVKGGDV